MAGQIRDGVVAGTLPVGGRLPSTRALAADLGVSRARHRAGLRPARRRGLDRGPARLRHVRRRRRRSPAPRHRPSAPRAPGVAPAPARHRDPVDRPPAPRRLAPRLARRLRRPRLPRRTTIPAGLPRPPRRARHPPRADPRPALRPRRDPGDHRDHRRPEPAARRAAAGPTSRTRTPATGPPPRRSGRPAARSSTCRPPSRSPTSTGPSPPYVTPAHQHPLGPVMPGAAGSSLLDAAARAGAVVIEDDYDSEFRYDVAPVPALAPSTATGSPTSARPARPSPPACGWAGWSRPPDLHRAILDAASRHPRRRRLARATRLPLPAPRRLRRPGRPLRPPDLRRTGGAGHGRAATPRRADPARGRYVCHRPDAPGPRAARPCVGAGGGVRGAAAERLLPHGAA